MKLKLLLIVVLLLNSLNSVSSLDELGVTEFDVWTYTDGKESKSGYKLVDENNFSMSVFQDNFWNLYSEQGMYTGYFINETGAEHSLYDTDEILEYASDYNILDITSKNITLDIVTKFNRITNESTYETTNMKRTDTVEFIGYSDYTFEDNTTVSTIDIKYTKDYSSKFGIVTTMYPDLNITGIVNNGVATIYENGVYNRTHTNLDKWEYIYQFSPAVFRVVNITRTDVIQSSLGLNSVNDNEDRHMLSYDVRNFVDWTSPDDIPVTSADDNTTFIIGIIFVAVIIIILLYKKFKY